MISRATIFWLVALAVMVAASITISLRVDHATREIRAIEASAELLREKIRVTEASYQSLIRIERLTKLAEQHLDIEELRGDQLVPLAALPERVPVPSQRPAPPATRRGAPPPRQALPTPGPALPAPGTPPWLEAGGQPHLQPVRLAPQQSRPE